MCGLTISTSTVTKFHFLFKCWVSSVLTLSLPNLPFVSRPAAVVSCLTQTEHSSYSDLRNNLSGLLHDSLSSKLCMWPAVNSPTRLTDVIYVTLLNRLLKKHALWGFPNLASDHFKKDRFMRQKPRLKER